MLRNGLDGSGLVFGCVWQKWSTSDTIGIPFLYLFCSITGYRLKERKTKQSKGTITLSVLRRQSYECFAPLPLWKSNSDTWYNKVALWWSRLTRLIWKGPEVSRRHNRRCSQEELNCQLHFNVAITEEVPSAIKRNDEDAMRTHTNHKSLKSHSGCS